VGVLHVIGQAGSGLVLDATVYLMNEEENDISNWVFIYLLIL
jgi:hypothetical protein